MWSALDRQDMDAARKAVDDFEEEIAHIVTSVKSDSDARKDQFRHLLCSHLDETISIGKALLQTSSHGFRRADRLIFSVVELCGAHSDLKTRRTIMQESLGVARRFESGPTRRLILFLEGRRCR